MIVYSPAVGSCLVRIESELLAVGHGVELSDEKGVVGRDVFREHPGLIYCSVLLPSLVTVIKRNLGMTHTTSRRSRWFNDE